MNGNNERSKINFATDALISTSVVGILLFAWFLAASSELYPDFILPSPAQVFSRFLILISEGYVGKGLGEHFGKTLFRAGAGFIFACLIGSMLGLAMGMNWKIQATFDPFVEFYRPIPPLAYLVLLVIWLGIGEVSKIAFLFLSALPPVVISAASAVRNVRMERVNGARSLGASEWQVFQYIVLPSCLPEILTGVRLAFGLSFATVVAAEMIAADSGLGFMVLHAQRYLRTDVVILVIIIMATTGMVFEQFFRWMQAILIPWAGRA